MLTEKINTTSQILNEVEKQFSPSAWVWLFSGGDDSLTCGKICNEILPKIDYAIFCDTGTCIPETKQFVVGTCKAMNIPLLIGNTTDKDSYEKYVLRFGFPGQNQKQHTVMYRMLKDHSLKRCISQIRQRRKNFHIALLTGARTDESTRRMATASKAIDKRGSDIWINPIQDWTKTDIYNYFKDRKIERSIVAQTIGRSGECNCGVFGSPQELDEIRLISPTFYDYMKGLEREVKEKGFDWGWGESPPQSWELISHGQMAFEGMKPDWYDKQMFMCSTCTNNNTYRDSCYKLTPDKQKALDEYNILKEVCHENTDNILAIGKMLNIEKQLLPYDKKIESLKKVIQEYAQPNF